MSVGEWDRRQLCPDGACVGVIGDAGTCKVCGRAAPNWGEERKRGLVADAADDAGPDDDEYEDDDSDEYEDDDEGDDEEEEDEIAPSAPAVMGQKANWNERMLCPDGACVGVIGDDGTCKVCGRVAPSAPKRKAVPAKAHTDEELTAAAADLASTMEPEDAGIAPALTDAEPPPDQAPAVDDLETERKLCPDGGCVGVIGPNGTCKVCGKAAA